MFCANQTWDIQSESIAQMDLFPSHKIQVLPKLLLLIWVLIRFSVWILFSLGVEPTPACAPSASGPQRRPSLWRGAQSCAAARGKVVLLGPRGDRPLAVLKRQRRRRRRRNRKKKLNLFQSTARIRTLSSSLVRDWLGVPEGILFEKWIIYCFVECALCSQGCMCICLYQVLLSLCRPKVSTTIENRPRGDIVLVTMTKRLQK